MFRVALAGDIGAAFGKIVLPTVAGTAPISLARNRMVGKYPLPFRVWGRHSWRSRANEGLYFKLVSIPYLTRDTDAAYSSLRRKKRHSLSGDSAVTPSEESEQLCRAVPNFLVGWNQAKH